MKKIYLTGFGLAVSALIIGCGSSSSDTTIDGTDTASAATAVISGTVPGTFIEAYCANGAYVSTTSVQNGTSQHPFSLSVPVNTSCRLVMTTNENDPAQRVTSQVTVNGQRSIVVTGNTDLGYVPLPATYAEATDSDGNHVQDHPVDVAPVSLNGYVTDDTGSNPYDDNHDGVVDGLEDRDGNGQADEWDRHDTENGMADDNGAYDTEGVNDNNGAYDTEGVNDNN